MNLRKKSLEIRAVLKKKANARLRKNAEKYFKEGIKLHGVKVPLVRNIAQKFHREMKKEIDCAGFLKLADLLVKTKTFEEQTIGIAFVRRCERTYDEKTFAIFERWLDKYVSNWAVCDDLCNHLISPMIERKPFLSRRLLLWTRSKNRWKRRAAAVSLVVPARRGLFLNDVFAVASRLMTDRDEFVQKGVGWLLKEASRRHKKEVSRFLLKWKTRASPLVLRLAMEKFSREEKKKVTGKKKTYGKG